MKRTINLQIKQCITNILWTIHTRHDFFKLKINIPYQHNGEFQTLSLSSPRRSWAVYLFFLNVAALTRLGMFTNFFGVIGVETHVQTVFSNLESRLWRNQKALRVRSHAQLPIPERWYSYQSVDWLITLIRENRAFPRRKVSLAHNNIKLKRSMPTKTGKYILPTNSINYLSD